MKLLILSTFLFCYIAGSGQRFKTLDTLNVYTNAEVLIYNGHHDTLWLPLKHNVVVESASVTNILNEPIRRKKKTVIKEVKPIHQLHELQPTTIVDKGVTYKLKPDSDTTARWMPISGSLVFDETKNFYPFLFYDPKDPAVKIYTQTIKDGKKVDLFVVEAPDSLSAIKALMKYIFNNKN